MAEPGPAAKPTQPAAPLLETLMRDTLDPSYERAAKRRATDGSPKPRSSTSWLAAGALIVGLLAAVAITTANANSPGETQARDALAADVTSAQAQQTVLAESASQLGEDVRSAQAAAGGGPLASLTTLAEMNALLEVTGPGLTIALDDPDAASGNGAILDRDLQVLVNSLWASGAEAIAIGGVRLRVTSAIRQAGGAILVDNRPVLWPMTVDAIGDPKTLHQAFIDTPGFGRFNSFTQLYGITFDVLVVDAVTLPAAAAVDNRYAQTPGQLPAGLPTTTATT